jgi:hypothetical protein
VIGAVTDFLAELDLDALIALLPVLRRTLGNLSSAERSYLNETLGSVLDLDDDDRDAAKPRPEEIALAVAADTEVSSVLARWRERNGIG